MPRATRPPRSGPRQRSRRRPPLRKHEASAVWRASSSHARWRVTSSDDGASGGAARAATRGQFPRWPPLPRRSRAAAGPRQAKPSRRPNRPETRKRRLSPVQPSKPCLSGFRTHRNLRPSSCASRVGRRSSIHPEGNVARQITNRQRVQCSRVVPRPLR